MDNGCHRVSLNEAEYPRDRLRYLGAEDLLGTDNIIQRDPYTIVYKMDKSFLGKPLFEYYHVYQDQPNTVTYNIFVANKDSTRIAVAYSWLPSGTYPFVSNDSVTKAFNSYLRPQKIHRLS